MRSGLENIDPGLAPSHLRRWLPERPCRRSAPRTAVRSPGGGGIQRDSAWRRVWERCSRSLCLSSCSDPPDGVARNSGAPCSVNNDNSTAEFCDIQAPFGTGCEITQGLVRMLRTIGALLPFAIVRAPAYISPAAPGRNRLRVRLRPESIFGYALSTLILRMRCNESFDF